MASQSTVWAVLTKWKMRDSNGMQCQRCLPTCGHVSGGKNHFQYALTRCFLPPSIQMILKQKSVRKEDHPEMPKRMHLTTLNGRSLRPVIHRQKCFGLIGARNICEVYGDENHFSAGHGDTTMAALFDMTETRFDIEASADHTMDEGLPAAIPFLPDNVVHHQGGALITGMDGELVWLDSDFKPITEVNVPFPMRIHQASISDGHLFATWLDRELLLANMAAIPVNHIASGTSRAEFRTSFGVSVPAHHPAGNSWSHSLDAEPLALASEKKTIVFVLYRRGLYSISTNAEERWRMPSPEWSYPRKRPRNDEIVALHIEGESFIITSRGGRAQRRSLETGLLLEEFILEKIEAPVEHHFKFGGHDLICSTNGEVTWLENQEVVHQIKLSGPVQHASWDARINGWRIAGWREECLVAKDRVERNETREIPMHVHPVGTGALLLFNDGQWGNSALES